MTYTLHNVLNHHHYHQYQHQHHHHHRCHHHHHHRYNHVVGLTDAGRQGLVAPGVAIAESASLPVQLVTVSNMCITL